jgi:iron complex transport system permease protein
VEAEINRVVVAPISAVHIRQQRSIEAVRMGKAIGRGGTALYILIGALLIALALSIAGSLSLGAIRIPLSSIGGYVFLRHPLSTTEATILFAIRLPRILASAVVGAALSISGLMFQGLFRNPMADPYIIGASGGAGLGACLGIVFFSQFSVFGFSATAMLAFAGSVVTMAVVYTLARARGQTSSVTLLLAGFAVGTMLSNSTYLFEIFDPESIAGTRIVAAWLHGVINVPQWRQLGVMSVMLAFSTLAAYPLMRRLNTLALGDEYAHQLGVRVELTRAGIILVGSLLTAAAVALGGLISFAGLIVPHVARLWLGPDHVRLLPVTALMGAIFLVVADTLARTLFAPAEIPVGILMVFLGGPFFLYLLRKNKREYSL